VLNPDRVIERLGEILSEAGEDQAAVLDRRVK
jgi:hypothetical protein